MNYIRTYYKLLIWFIVIGILCFTPGSEFKSVKINIQHFDKIVHFAMFYIFGLLAQSISYNPKSVKNVILIFAFIYAGLIEIIQSYFVPMRNGDVIDFIFDLFGLLMGLITLKFYPKFIQKKLN